MGGCLSRRESAKEEEELVGIPGPGAAPVAAAPAAAPAEASPFTVACAVAAATAGALPRQGSSAVGDSASLAPARRISSRLLVQTSNTIPNYPSGGTSSATVVGPAAEPSRTAPILGRSLHDTIDFSERAAHGGSVTGVTAGLPAGPPAQAGANSYVVDSFSRPLEHSLLDTDFVPLLHNPDVTAALRGTQAGVASAGAGGGSGPLAAPGANVQPPNPNPNHPNYFIDPAQDCYLPPQRRSTLTRGLTKDSFILNVTQAGTNSGTYMMRTATHRDEGVPLGESCWPPFVMGNPLQVHVGELLGRGGCGSVFRGTWRGRAVAIKVVQQTHLQTNTASSPMHPHGTPQHIAGMIDYFDRPQVDIFGSSANIVADGEAASGGLGSGPGTAGSGATGVGSATAGSDATATGTGTGGSTRQPLPRLPLPLPLLPAAQSRRRAAARIPALADAHANVLRHPNILRTYAYAVLSTAEPVQPGCSTANAVPQPARCEHHVLLELCDGGTLRAWLDRLWQMGIATDADCGSSGAPSGSAGIGIGIGTGFYGGGYGGGWPPAAEDRCAAVAAGAAAGPMHMTDPPPPPAAAAAAAAALPMPMPSLAAAAGGGGVDDSVASELTAAMLAAATAALASGAGGRSGAPSALVTGPGGAARADSIHSGLLATLAASALVSAPSLPQSTPGEADFLRAFSRAQAHISTGIAPPPSHDRPSPSSTSHSLFPIPYALIESHTQALHAALHAGHPPISNSAFAARRYQRPSLDYALGAAGTASGADGDGDGAASGPLTARAIRSAAAAGDGPGSLGSRGLGLRGLTAAQSAALELMGMDWVADAAVPPSRTSAASGSGSLAAVAAAALASAPSPPLTAEAPLGIVLESGTAEGSEGPGRYGSTARRGGASVSGGGGGMRNPVAASALPSAPYGGGRSSAEAVPAVHMPSMLTNAMSEPSGSGSGSKTDGTPPNATAAVAAAAAAASAVHVQAEDDESLLPAVLMACSDASSCAARPSAAEVKALRSLPLAKVSILEPAADLISSPEPHSGSTGTAGRSPFCEAFAAEVVRTTPRGPARAGLEVAAAPPPPPVATAASGLAAHGWTGFSQSHAGGGGGWGGGWPGGSGLGGAGSMGGSTFTMAGRSSLQGAGQGGAALTATCQHLVILDDMVEEDEEDDTFQSGDPSIGCGGGGGGMADGSSGDIRSSKYGRDNASLFSKLHLNQPLRRLEEGSYEGQTSSHGRSQSMQSHSMQSQSAVMRSHSLLSQGGTANEGTAGGTATSGETTNGTFTTTGGDFSSSMRNGCGGGRTNTGATGTTTGGAGGGSGGAGTSTTSAAHVTGSDVRLPGLGGSGVRGGSTGGSMTAQWQHVPGRTAEGGSTGAQHLPPRTSSAPAPSDHSAGASMGSGAAPGPPSPAVRLPPRAFTSSANRAATTATLPSCATPSTTAPPTTASPTTPTDNEVVTAAAARRAASMVASILRQHAAASGSTGGTGTGPGTGVTTTQQSPVVPPKPAVRRVRRSQLRHLVVALECLAEVAAGLSYLHGVGMVHGDVKSGNVLLKLDPRTERGFILKLADFGFSRKLEHGSHTYLSRPSGTLAYLSPELLTSYRQSPASDVYAFGLLIWETVTTQPLFRGLATAQLLYAKTHNTDWKHLPWPRWTPPEVEALARQCADPDPGARLTASQALEALEALKTRFQKELAAEAPSPAPSPVTRATATALFNRPPSGHPSPALTRKASRGEHRR